MKYTQAVKLFKNGTLSKEIGSDDVFEVQETFVWYIDYNKKSTYFTVNKGFKTNFGSIPKIMQIFFTPTKYLSYILHDATYTKGMYLSEEIWDKIYRYSLTRKECDKILLEGLKVEWAWYIERNMIYWGVRLGGFLHFKK